MDQTAQLLQRTVENARMGESAIGQLIEKTKDQPLKDELVYQQSQYRMIAQEAENKLSSSGVAPKSNSPFSQIGAWVGIEKDAMMNHSNSHFADMMIQGNTMGVIDMTKARNEFPEAEEWAHGLASNFLAKQQDGIERMKSFL